MQSHDANQLDRRGFLQTGVAATAAVAALGSTLAPSARGDEPQQPQAKGKVIPRRKLGKTGIDVTMLNLGTWQSPGLDRLLKFAWANGIRYYDTAKSYGSEPAIGKWLTENPEIRKQIFLVTKDSPHNPKDLVAMVDQRLKALKTDYLDMVYIHALGDHHSEADAVEIAAGGQGFKEAIETLKKSGKTKFVGFSTHHRTRAAIIESAAKANVVDAIMVQFNPWLDKDTPLNKALDSAHKAGIGLISMKQVAGNMNLEQVAIDNVPGLKDKKLTPYQALLHALWSDERISTCCVSMRNTDQIRINTDAAVGYKGPLKQAQLDALRDAVLAAGPTLCTNCDGRCAVAGKTDAALGDLTRLLTYHDHHGYRGEARRLYSQMTEADRNWAGVDLDAAREACPSKLNFASLLPRVDKTLA